ncbi:unnamed protein product [Coregonus sp. 'balchen']|nr:unnamed protein product [Coregonus sp. 'balchen']
MLPGSIHGNTGQSSPSPYTVTVSQTTYQPGDTIQVTLSGTIPFSGFLLEAHEEGQNTAVGTFSLGSGSGYKFVLRVKFTSTTKLTESEILKQLREELIRRGLPGDFTMRLRIVQS